MTCYNRLKFNIKPKGYLLEFLSSKSILDRVHLVPTSSALEEPLPLEEIDSKPKLVATYSSLIM